MKKKITTWREDWPSDCIPEPGCRTLEIHTTPDKENNQSFTIYWFGYNPSTDRDEPRAQEFHARVLEHIALGDKVIDRTTRRPHR